MSHIVAYNGRVARVSEFASRRDLRGKTVTILADPPYAADRVPVAVAGDDAREYVAWGELKPVPESNTSDPLTE